MSAIGTRAADFISQQANATGEGAGGGTIVLRASQLPTGVQPGDRLTATVISAPDLTALFGLAGQRVAVRAAAPPAGSRIPVTVASADGQAAGPAVPRFFRADSLPAGARVGDRFIVTVLESSDGPLQLALNGQPVQLQAAPFDVGSQLTVRVRSLGPQPTLDVVTPTAERASPSDGLTLGQLGLAEGAVVSAEVAAPAGDGRPRVTIQGQTVPADLPENFRPGTRLTVQAAETSSGPLLSIIDQQPPAELHLLPLIQAGLSGPPAAGESLTALSQALDQVFSGTGGPSGPRSGDPPADVPYVPPAGLSAGRPSPLDQGGDRVRGPAAETPAPSSTLGRLRDLVRSLTPDPQPRPGQVAAWVRDSGLTYEAKLAAAAADGGRPDVLQQTAGSDLKGLLLRAGAAGGASREVLAAVLGHLRQIEGQQAANTLARLHQSPYQLQIPVWDGQRLGTAALSVEADGGPGSAGQGPAKGFNLYFSLDLTGLGRTNIDAHVGPDSLRVIFYVPAGDALRTVDAGLSGFQADLRALGYREVLLAARPLGDLSPAKRDKFQPRAPVTASGRLVDTRG